MKANEQKPFRLNEEQQQVPLPDAVAAALDPVAFQEEKEAESVEQLRSSQEDADNITRIVMIERVRRINDGEPPPAGTRHLSHTCASCSACPPNFVGEVDRKTGGFTPDTQRFWYYPT